MSFKDKVVWITGASSGIGKALAQELSVKGARLILSARREEVLEAVKGVCAGNKDNIRVVPMDVSDTQQAQANVDAVVAEFGHVDIFISNAGISQRSLVKDTDMAVYEQLMQVNYFGPVALTKALLPAMSAGHGGQIAVISSVLGRASAPSRAGYAASKHALHGFFDALRAEAWADGIDVTMICPGFVDTDIAVNALSADGSTWGQRDQGNAGGISADQASGWILSAITDRKEEVAIGGKERFGVALKRYLPSLYSKKVRGLDLMQ